MIQSGQEGRKPLQTLDDLHNRQKAQPSARLELINGVIQVKIATVRASLIAARIGMFLRHHAEQRRQGIVTSAKFAYVLSATERYLPEVGFLLIDRLDESENESADAPTIAVEIVHPARSLRPTLDRIHAYLGAGTEEVWMVYPDERLLDVHLRLAPGHFILHEYGLDDTYRNEMLLPGFSLPILDIFRQSSEKT